MIELENVFALKNQKCHSPCFTNAEQQRKAKSLNENHMSLVPKWIWTLMKNCNSPETLQHLLQQPKVIVKIEAALQHNITQDESHHLLRGFSGQACDSHHLKLFWTTNSMWPKIWGLVFNTRKFGLAFVKTTDTKDMFISDDLKRENIQKSESSSKKQIKNCCV